MLPQPLPISHASSGVLRLIGSWGPAKKWPERSRPARFGQRLSRSQSQLFYLSGRHMHLVGPESLGSGHSAGLHSPLSVLSIWAEPSLSRCSGPHFQRTPAPFGWSRRPSAFLSGRSISTGLYTHGPRCNASPGRAVLSREASWADKIRAFIWLLQRLQMRCWDWDWDWDW